MAKFIIAGSEATKQRREWIFFMYICLDVLHIFSPE